jgi:hypothetical protein
MLALAQMLFVKHHVILKCVWGVLVPAGHDLAIIRLRLLMSMSQAQTSKVS